jgi:hypothetical protein
LVKLKTECENSKEKINELNKQILSLNELVEKERGLNKQLTHDLESQQVLNHFLNHSKQNYLNLFCF